MNSFQKNEMKKWIKKRKIWLIGSGVALLLGLIFLFVGMYMNGFRLIDWLKSGYFITFVVITVSFILILMFLGIELARSKLGGDDDE